MFLTWSLLMPYRKHCLHTPTTSSYLRKKVDTNGMILKSQSMTTILFYTNIDITNIYSSLEISVYYFTIVHDVLIKCLPLTFFQDAIIMSPLKFKSSASFPRCPSLISQYEKKQKQKQNFFGASIACAYIYGRTYHTILCACGKNHIP